MMSNVVKMANRHDWKYFDKRLTELRTNDVENIIERGRVLQEAKDELEHGSWEGIVKRHFDIKTAQRLMKIARDPVLSNGAHAHLLPASWMTLYELTKLDESDLRAKIKDGTINPKTERKDVREMRGKPPAKRKETPKNTKPGIVTALDMLAAATAEMPRERRIEIACDLFDRIHLDEDEVAKAFKRRKAKRGEMGPVLSLN